MATSLVRRAATLTRLSIPSSSSASLVSRRGFSGAADHHGSTKANFWDQPTNPGNWKEEQFVIISLTGWGVGIYGIYKFFTRGKKTEAVVVEKLPEAAAPSK